MGMLIGINPQKLATCSDPDMLITYVMGIERADEILAEWREDLANRIANAVGQLFKK